MTQLPEIQIINPTTESVDQADKRLQLGYLQQVIRLADQDYLIRDHLNQKLHEVLAFAHLRGYEVDDWNHMRYGRIEDFDAKRN